VGNISPSDHALAQCVGGSPDAPDAPAPNCDAALDALAALVASFAPPELDAAQAGLWIHTMTQYLLQRDRDVYLGYLAPITVQ
jgi:hypothetical protein